MTKMTNTPGDGMTNTPGAPRLWRRLHVSTTPLPNLARRPRVSLRPRAQRPAAVGRRTRSDGLLGHGHRPRTQCAPRRVWSIRNATDARRSPSPRTRVDRYSRRCYARAWGVAPTDRRWGDRLAREHLFSVGNDPFGVSRRAGATLPFHVSDAIKRNEVFASTAETTRDAAALLDAVATFADGERALGPDAHAEFVGRWASMEHKRRTLRWRPRRCTSTPARLISRRRRESISSPRRDSWKTPRARSTRRLSVSRTSRRRTRRRRRSRGRWRSGCGRSRPSGGKSRGGGIYESASSSDDGRIGRGEPLIRLNRRIRVTPATGALRRDAGADRTPRAIRAPRGPSVTRAPSEPMYPARHPSRCTPRHPPPSSLLRAAAVHLARVEVVSAEKRGVERHLRRLRRPLRQREAWLTAVRPR